MKQKKTEDSSFGEQSTTLETLESRGMSTDNYEKILVRKAGDKTSVYIVEKKRLSGFKLCGTLDNLTITKGNECELYELNASITEFNGKEEYEYYDVKPTIDGYVVVGFDYVKKYFQYSILENYNARTDDHTILARESWWKLTLGTRAFGLNSN